MNDPLGQPALLFHDIRVIRAAGQKYFVDLSVHQLMKDLERQIKAVVGRGIRWHKGHGVLFALRVECALEPF
jgi:hypothetical protein